MRMQLGIVVGFSMVLGWGAVGRAGGEETFEVQFKVVSMPNLEWRTKASKSLQAVRSGGAVSVWTAPRSVLATLAASGGKVIEKPKCITRGKAKISIAWNGQEPGTVAPEASEGEIAIEFEGRSLDQGVLAQLAFEETRGTPNGSHEFRGRRGEWLIGKEQILIVSLGTSVTSDVRTLERLAVVEVGVPVASAVGSMGVRDEAAVRSGWAPLLPTVPVAEVAATAAVPTPLILKMPPMPSRSLPIGILPNGETVVAKAPVDLEIQTASSDPSRPSPQAVQVPQVSGVDVDLVLSGYDESDEVDPSGPLKFEMPEFVIVKSTIPSKPSAAKSNLLKIGEETGKAIATIR